MDARHVPRGRGVDTPDPGMGVGAAHEGRVQQPRQRDVVDEAALSGQQRRILEARDPRAEVLCAHALTIRPEFTRPRRQAR